MAGVFAESALAAIEFPAALEQVSEYAVTPLGKDAVRALLPTADRDWIASELARVAAFAALLAAGDDVEPVVFPDVRTPLVRLALEGSVLDGAELAALGVLLAAARAAGAKLRRAARTHACLSPVAAPPLPDELEQALTKALDPEGRVLDTASKDLARIRRDLVKTRNEIVTALERILGGVPAKQRGEAGVTIRNGRYVIPLRKDGRTKLGGIVHDESATHATLFVEPAETIEMGNRLRALEAEEAREVQRILRELSALLRPHRDGMAAAFAMLIAMDALYARARCAGVLGAVVPRLGVAGRDALALHGAAHPLLFGRGSDVVRFELVLEPGERTVLVSGPNTGGKTVLLKAVGLAAALTQAGLLPAAGEGTVVPVFARCFADIGDRQSIRESLSTFSAHVAALREIVADAGDDALVLLDELGTGTDPAEGGALAGAVLRALTARGATTVATTHLGALKELAARTPGVVNASLAFDAATLTPTYRFAKGVPGRSYGLAIARRLGLEEAVVAEAEQALPTDERRLDAALAAAEARSQELDRRATELESRAAALDLDRAAFDAERARLEEREDSTTRREKELERAGKRGARDYLLEARTEVERALALAKDGRDKEARRLLEERVAALGEAARAAQEEGVPETPLEPLTEPLTAGLRVRIRSLGIEGEIENIRGDDVAVRVRDRRVRVKAADLAKASSQPGRTPARPHARTP